MARWSQPCFPGDLTGLSFRSMAAWTDVLPQSLLCTGGGNAKPFDIAIAAPLSFLLCLPAMRQSLGPSRHIHKRLKYQTHSANRPLCLCRDQGLGPQNLQTKCHIRKPPPPPSCLRHYQAPAVDASASYKGFSFPSGLPDVLMHCANLLWQTVTGWLTSQCINHTLVKLGVLRLHATWIVYRRSSRRERLIIILSIRGKDVW